MNDYGTVQGKSKSRISLKSPDIHAFDENKGYKKKYEDLR